MLLMFSERQDEPSAASVMNWCPLPSYQWTDWDCGCSRLSVHGPRSVERGGPRYAAKIAASADCIGHYYLYKTETKSLSTSRRDSRRWPAASQLRSGYLPSAPFFLSAGLPSGGAGAAFSFKCKKKRPQGSLFQVVLSMKCDNICIVTDFFSRFRSFFGYQRVVANPYFFLSAGLPSARAGRGGGSVLDGRSAMSCALFYCLFFAFSFFFDVG